MQTGIIQDRASALRLRWTFAFQRDWARAALGLSLSVVFLLAIAPANAWSQNNRGLGLLLEKGQQLEAQHHWGEALSHYEKSLRKHPSDPSLRRLHDLAKLHYGLEHRYHDNSFQQSIDLLEPHQALSLYSELLQKLKSHYVNMPPWHQLGSRGLTALDIALSDTLFQQANGLQNRPQLTPGHMPDVRRQLAQALNRHAINGPKDLIALARDVAQRLEREIGLRQSATILEFITSAAGGLDNYSAYLTSNQLRDIYSQIEGNFVGLGVELRADHGALLIVHVIPGSPAEKSGIHQGDRIVAVDGQTTSSLSTDEAAALLTGEEGTWVQITAHAPGQKPRILKIRREHVDVPSLEDVDIVDADFGVAYIRVPAFQKTTSRDLETALWELHRQGMRSLVLDLRGNPGGLLTSSVEVADKFLTQGKIVSTRGRSTQEDFNYQAHYGGTWRVPLVVLIDGDSASASEIFASAIKDNNRGLLIGSRSYGKGSVQGIFPLGYAGSGIRLTTAKFFSPKDQAISGHGVVPDRKIQAHRAARPTELGLVIETSSRDAALDAAIEAARSRIAAR
jgi:carboxyl-terminal processing protease